MNKLKEQDLCAMGRLLYLQRIWGQYRKYLPEEAKDFKSPLEENGVNIEEAESKFKTKLEEYLSTVPDRDKAIKTIRKDIESPFTEAVLDIASRLTEENKRAFAFNLRWFI